MALLRVIKFVHSEVDLHLALPSCTLGWEGQGIQLRKVPTATMLSKYITDCEPRQTRTLAFENI